MALILLRRNITRVCLIAIEAQAALRPHCIAVLISLAVHGDVRPERIAMAVAG